MREAVEYSQERPVLIDHFLEDAVEVDVDALCDGDDVLIAGIMQHIEEAGIHSGDSSCVLPAVDLATTCCDTIREYTRKLALALNVDRPDECAVRHPARQGRYVIEVNPRASRTVPYVSKATGVPLAKIASRLMSGRKLQELLPEQVASGKDLGTGIALLREVAGLPVEQVPRRRHGARAGDEVHRRSDGRGRQLRRGVRQGADSPPGRCCRTRAPSSSA